MSDFETMRFGLRAAVVAIAFGAMGSVNAAVVFSDVAASSGLQFTSEDGTAFDFSDLPPSEAAEMEIIQRIQGNGSAVGDYDNDGDLDVYMLAGLGVPNALFRNDLVETGVLQFTDVTATAGLANTGLSRVAHFTDLDNDGLLDLVLVNDSDPEGLHPRSVIYRNDGGGVFTDVTAGSGFEPIGYVKGGLAIADYDQDGLLDIYVTHWTIWRGILLPGSGYNRLFRNLGEFQFEDVTAAFGLILQSDCYTPIFADFDNDGDPDLYVALDGATDIFYRQDDGVFVYAPEVGLTHIGTDMGAIAFDFDHDGDLDIYSTNVTWPDDVYGGNALMVNKLVETGELSFVDEALERGVFNTGWGWGTEWIDVDNSGSHELFAVNGFDEFIPVFYPSPSLANVVKWLVDLRCFLFQETSPGIYTEVPQSGADFNGDSRTTIAFDADRDGRQELLVTNVNSEVVLLHNQTTPTGHWITVKLIGGGPVSRDAIGARVFITVGTETLMQELVGGGSFLAGRPYELHFGLGAPDTIDELRVVWPNGHENVVLDLPVDQVFVIQYTECAADFDGDGMVGFSDLTGLLASWGPCGATCLEDLDGDNVIGFTDLTALLAAWGPC